MPHLARMMKHIWKHDLSSIFKYVFSKCVSFPVCLLKDYPFMEFWLWCWSVYARWIVKVVAYYWSHCYIYEGINCYIVHHAYGYFFFISTVLKTEFSKCNMFVYLHVCVCVCGREQEIETWPPMLYTWLIIN